MIMNFVRPILLSLSFISLNCFALPATKATFSLFSLLSLPVTHSLYLEVPSRAKFPMTSKPKIANLDQFTGKNPEDFLSAMDKQELESFLKEHRHFRDSMWKEVQTVLEKDENHNDFLSRYEAALQKGSYQGLTLSLNPEYKAPNYLFGRPSFHRAPRGYVGDQEGDSGKDLLYGLLLHFGYKHFLKIMSGGHVSNDEGETLGKKLIDTLSHFMPDEPTHIVDLGSGAGNNLKPWRECFSQDQCAMTCVEPGEAGCKAAYLNAYAHSLSNINFVQDDAIAWLNKQPSNSVDIISSHILLHEFDPSQYEELFSEVHRVLKPGGLFANIDVNFRKDEPQDQFMAVLEGEIASEIFMPQFAMTDFEALLASTVGDDGKVIFERDGYLCFGFKKASN